MSLTPGTQVGRYRVIRMIAQGGMAEVYRAEQELAAGIYRPAALKVIRPEYAQSADFREMFLDEARTACTLAHPHIVHIYEVGDAEGRLFMAMELVPGQTVATVARTLRERGERFADEGLLAIGVFTCSALEAVHALRLPNEGHLNLVHRDVSPHNLLLGPSGSLKLIDFGIAKAAHNRNLTSPGVTKGKAGYFSPEQAMGKPLDGRSDLFSLGVMLYKLAYGATPFDEYQDHHSRNTALVHGRWLPLRQVCAGLPSGFYDVVDRALALKPEDRWPDARSMREALEEVALETGVSLGPSSLAYYVPEEPENETGGARPTRVAPATALRPLTPPPPSRPEEVPLEGTRTVAEGGRTVLDLELSAPLPPERTQVTSPWGRGKGLLGALLAVLLVGGVWGGMQWGGSSHDEGRAPPVPAAGPPQAAVGQASERVAQPEPPGRVDATGRAEGKAPVDAGARSDTAARSTVDAKAERSVHGDARAPMGGPRSDSKPMRVTPVRVVPEKVTGVTPEGEGLLRVGTDTEAQVRIGDDGWEPTPLNRRIRAGRYRVELKASSGQKGSCDVQVLADRRMILRYDFRSGACSESPY